MKIYKYPAEGKLPFEGCAVALGFFDGVHLAHREIISATVTEAQRRGLTSCVFTFSSEEGAIKRSAKRIYSTEEKLRLIETLGADAAVIADFGAISEKSAENFVLSVLAEDLKCKLALCGYNFRFGKNASGNSELLGRLMQKTGGEAIVFNEFTHEGKALSSSAVREALARGDVSAASRMLGAPYRLSGRVEHGLGQGRTFGIPTVNIDLPESRVAPRLGVYRALTEIGGRVYTAVTNVGVCPTFGSRSVHAEAHIVDFSGDLYGRELRIFFMEFLREEKSFPDKESLLKQIRLDTETAVERNKEFLENKKWTEIGLN